MPNGYSRSPRLIKGALVELVEPFLGPIPNIIVFQYNPENLTRSLTPYNLPTAEERKSTAPKNVQPFDPEESFTLSLLLDASDDLEVEHPVAVISGVKDRVAAIEKLLYPIEDLAVPLTFGAGKSADVVMMKEAPLVLFVWGPSMILPVRLTSYQIEEQAFSPTLFPIRARISLGMKVLTPEALSDRNAPSASKELALTAYEYTKAQREVLARANLAHSAESILGMLPF